MADYEKLLAAVQDHADLEKGTFEDISRGGADAGWPKFTYYHDTVAFYDKNEDLIWEHLYDTAEGMGEDSALSLIASFSGAKDVNSDSQFKNLLAWFILEEVAHQVADGELELEEVDYTESDVGTYIDGAYGQDHAYKKMADLIEEYDPDMSRDLREIAERMGTDDEEEDDPENGQWMLDEGTDLLQQHTAKGLVWYWEAGDLTLMEESEVY